MAFRNGTPQSDTLVGTDEPDTFRLEQGGSDDASGGAGNDTFYLGGALDANDVIKGEAGSDTLVLQGDYGAGVTLANVTTVETIRLLSGNNNEFGAASTAFASYDLTAVNANAAAGTRLTVDGSGLRAGENLTFNGAAEMDGSFLIYAGAGTDSLTGGAQNDGFLFRGGTYQFGDQINGGGGSGDQIAFRGDFFGENAISIADGSLTGVEAIVLLSSSDARFGTASSSPFNYQIEMADNNIAPGSVFTVDGAQLASNESLGFDGFQSTVGSFRLIGGKGNDALIGGANGDFLRGGLGKDALDGAEGADTFFYKGPTDSTGSGFDTINLFDKREDKVDLPTQVSGYNGLVQQGQLNLATFDSDLAAALDPSLQGFGVVLFTPSAGDFAGRIFAVIDGNGDGNYTVNADYVVELVDPVVPLDQDIGFFI